MNIMEASPTLKSVHARSVLPVITVVALVILSVVWSTFFMKNFIADFDVVFHVGS